VLKLRGQFNLDREWILMKLCFTLVLILLFSACAKRTQKITPVIAKSSWLKTSSLYNHLSHDGEFLIHPFFDLVPFGSRKDNSINFVMTTPAGSMNKYKIDLRSGMMYRRHQFCDQQDIWKKYSGDIYRPPYTEGFVPRLLDQLGTPQKIIVFGKKRYFQDFELTPTRSQRVRIVGGVLQQYCKAFPCRGKNRWQSRLVLVAVNSFDPEFEKIYHINQLKRVVDWPYAKAFLENSDGRHISGKENTPAYRVIGNLGPKESLVNSISKGHLFKFEKLKTLRNSCHKFYDHVWNSVEEIRKRKKLKESGAKATRARIWDKTEIFSGNVLSGEEKTVSSKEVVATTIRTTDFATFFNHFYKNYKDRFITCQKFVRDTSVNSNRRRLWFFSYMSSFLNAEQLGYIYSCSRQTWIENPLLSSGKRMYTHMRNLKNCTSRELDRSFDMSITVQTGLYRSFQEHDRFIEYDEGGGATHQKIYSWIRSSGDGYSCDRSRYGKLSIFPQDIVWESFGEKGMRKRTDIIK